MKRTAAGASIPSIKIEEKQDEAIIKMREELRALIIPLQNKFKSRCLKHREYTEFSRSVTGLGLFVENYKKASNPDDLVILAEAQAWLAVVVSRNLYENIMGIYDGSSQEDPESWQDADNGKYNADQTASILKRIEAAADSISRSFRLRGNLSGLSGFRNYFLVFPHWRVFNTVLQVFDAVAKKLSNEKKLIPICLFWKYEYIYKFISDSSFDLTKKINICEDTAERIGALLAEQLDNKLKKKALFLQASIMILLGDLACQAKYERGVALKSPFDFYYKQAISILEPIASPEAQLLLAEVIEKLLHKHIKDERWSAVSRLLSEPIEKAEKLNDKAALFKAYYNYGKYFHGKLAENTLVENDRAEKYYILALKVAQITKEKIDHDILFKLADYFFDLKAYAKAYQVYEVTVAHQISDMHNAKLLFSKLNSLQFSCGAEPSPNYTNLAQFIRVNLSLKSINIENDRIEDSDAALLADVLKERKHVKLTLIKCIFSNAALNLLAPYLDLKRSRLSEEQKALVALPRVKVESEPGEDAAMAEVGEQKHHTSAKADIPVAAAYAVHSVHTADEARRMQQAPAAPAPAAPAPNGRKKYVAIKRSFPALQRH